MKRPHRASEADSTGGARDSIALAGPRRLVVSHCPGCMQPHTDAPAMLACLIGDDLTRDVYCELCPRCARRMDKAGRRGRQRLLDRMERNLEAMGATVGLERVGARA